MLFNSFNFSKAAMPSMLLFQEISGIEELIKHDKLVGADIATCRNDIAKPLWETFRLWCLDEILNHEKNSQMYTALNYVIRRVFQAP